MSEVNFDKRPPSQYRRPDFYWRGGDALREQAYLSDEYKAALAEYRKAELDYKNTEKAVAAAESALADKEGYTAALANYLEADTSGSNQTQKLKQELASLENEITELEEQIRSVQAIQNPAYASSLQKEKALMLIEIQRGKKEAQNLVDEGEEARRQEAACMVNDRYRESVELEFKVEEKKSKSRYLSKLVARTKKSFEAKDEPPQKTKPDGTKKSHRELAEEGAALRAQYRPDQSEQGREMRKILNQNLEINVECQRLEERWRERNYKRERKLKFMLDEIEELNDRMHDIGLEQCIVDTDQLREQVFDGNSENGDFESDEQKKSEDFESDEKHESNHEDNEDFEGKHEEEQKSNTIESDFE